MKAIVIYESGGPDKLIYTDVPKPSIKPGWSLVQIMGAGVNHSEVYTRQGQSPDVEFPRILGIECVGTISETTDPDRLPIGQKVVSIMGEMGRAYDGGYAEFCLIPNDQIYPVYTEMPWEVLAAVPETYYTAFGSFKNLEIKKHDTMLVRGATSGVGIAFLKLVRAGFPGMRIVGTSRSSKKAPRLMDAGFDDVVIDQDGILQTDEKFDKVLELIGPAVIRDTFRHTNEFGIVCNTGLLGGKWTIDDLDPIMDLPPNGYLTGFYSGNVDETRLNEMLTYIEEHEIDVAPEMVFPLSDAEHAHEYLEGVDSYGKAVLVPDNQ